MWLSFFLITVVASIALSVAAIAMQDATDAQHS
jgi:hypothetical protein